MIYINYNCSLELAADKFLNKSVNYVKGGEEDFELEEVTGINVGDWVEVQWEGESYPGEVMAVNEYGRYRVGVLYYL